MKHRRKIVSSGQAVNLVQNPTPGVDCFGWTPRNGNAQPACYLGYGEGIVCTAMSNGQNYGFFYNDSPLSGLGLQVGDTISARLDVVSNTGPAVQLCIRFMSGSSTLSNATGTSVTTGTAVCENVVIPATCDSLILFTVSAATAAGQAACVNRLMLVKAASAPATFTPGHALRPADAVISTTSASVRTTSLPTGPLPWAAPISNPSSATIINVTDDPATRYITLSSGQDAILVLPNTPISDSTYVANNDSLITVTGGRHVQVIGGHISAVGVPPTRLTAALGSSETTIPVASTAGFPSTGAIRLDGEAISYTSKSATAFLGCTRNNGFFNSGTGSSTTAHALGALVYVGENARSGITFFNQTGTVHVEGVLIDGFINDGIRIFRNGGNAGVGTLQIQNCHIEGNRNRDMLNATDGHPDCVQVIAAPGELRIARCTFMSLCGQGILNQGGANGSILPLGTIQDTEFISLGPGTTYSITDSDSPSTTWNLTNVWELSANGTHSASTAGLDAQFTKARSGQVIGQFCPASVAGVGYVSPGY